MRDDILMNCAFPISKNILQGEFERFLISRVFPGNTQDET
jgi:hypothetical protein